MDNGRKLVIGVLCFSSLLKDCLLYFLNSKENSEKYSILEIEFLNKDSLEVNVADINEEMDYVLVEICRKMDRERTKIMIKTILEKTKTKIIVMGHSDQKWAMADCVREGAWSFFLMDHLDAADLVESIEYARQGYCSRYVLGTLAGSDGDDENGDFINSGDYSELTLREKEILKLVNQGFSNKQIAKKLCLSIYTVKNHVHNIISKIGLKRRSRVRERL